MLARDNLSAGLIADFGVVNKRDGPVVTSFGCKDSDDAWIPPALTVEMVTHCKMAGLHHNSLYTMII